MASDEDHDGTNAASNDTKHQPNESDCKSRKICISTKSYIVDAVV